MVAIGIEIIVIIEIMNLESDNNDFIMEYADNRNHEPSLSTARWASQQQQVDQRSNCFETPLALALGAIFAFASTSGLLARTTVLPSVRRQSLTSSD